MEQLDLQLGAEVLKYICIGMIEDMKKDYDDENDEELKIKHKAFTELSFAYGEAKEVEPYGTELELSKILTQYLEELENEK